MSESADVFEYEAKLFLYYKYVKELIQLEKENRARMKKKQRKRLQPIRPKFKDEDFQSILQQIENENPPFLEATILRICISIFKYIDPKQGVQMSQQNIIDSELSLIVNSKFYLIMEQKCSIHV